MLNCHFQPRRQRRVAPLWPIGKIYYVSVMGLSWAVIQLLSVYVRKNAIGIAWILLDQRTHCRKALCFVLSGRYIVEGEPHTEHDRALKGLPRISSKTRRRSIEITLNQIGRDALHLSAVQ